MVNTIQFLYNVRIDQVKYCIQGKISHGVLHRCSDIIIFFYKYSDISRQCDIEIMSWNDNAM